MISHSGLRMPYDVLSFAQTVRSKGLLSEGKKPLLGERLTHKYLDQHELKPVNLKTRCPWCQWQKLISRLDFQPLSVGPLILRWIYESMLALELWLAIDSLNPSWRLWHPMGYILVWGPEDMRAIPVWRVYQVECRLFVSTKMTNSNVALINSHVRFLKHRGRILR